MAYRSAGSPPASGRQQRALARGSSTWAVEIRSAIGLPSKSTPLARRSAAWSSARSSIASWFSRVHHLNSRFSRTVLAAAATDTHVWSMKRTTTDPQAPRLTPQRTMGRRVWHRAGLMPTHRGGLGQPERRWPGQDWMDAHPYLSAAIGFTVSAIRRLSGAGASIISGNGGFSFPDENVDEKWSMVKCTTV